MYMYTEDDELTGHIQCDSEQAGEFLERVSLAMEEYGRQEMGNKVSARELCQIAKIFLQTVRKEY